MSQILIEEEAKTKWCPFAKEHQGRNRTYKFEGGKTENFGELGSVVVGAQRISGPAVDCMCIASTCMAWEEVDNGVQSIALLDHMSYKTEEECIAMFAEKMADGWAISAEHGTFMLHSTVYPARLTKKMHATKGQCSALTHQVNVESTCSR